MENTKADVYLKAKKKVETLKAFYSHLIVYVLVNSAIILVSANVFNDKEINFYKWSNYITALFWGIGIISHALYVFYVMKIENNMFKRWEEKKINEFLEKDL